ncbi:MAG: YHYH protein [Verrucomicrobiales bacterium]
MKLSIPQVKHSARDFLLVTSFLPLLVEGEPILDSWYTEGSSRYARIWATQTQEITERSGGGTTSLTTWDSSDYADVVVGDQPSPAYAGIQGISFSDDYVYIKATGLATNTMGPWFLDEARTTQFPSFPGNALILYRFPRKTNYAVDYSPSSRTATAAGACGLFVDGVPLFNSGDTFSYDSSAGADQEPTNNNQGDGIWNRDAFSNEGVTFDAGNSHQAEEQFHYHASPAALRSTLGDSVDYDPSVVYQGLGGASPYTENFNGQHSPIIAWTNDGLPMYGPYGYSDPMDSESGVRRMITGYQKRDGSNDSTDLSLTGRTSLPQWSVDQGQADSRTLSSTEYGPDVSDGYQIGHYMEDYAFKGNLISDASGTAMEPYTDPSTQGEFDDSLHYDLNEFNVRYCVTPEFPEGTWAYFTNVAADGTPVYPYNIGYQYFGDASLASGIDADEVESSGVTTQFDGAASMEPSNAGITQNASNRTVTITWQGIEGGIYRIETSDDLQTWDEEADSFIADSDSVTSEDSDPNSSSRFYRLVQTGIDDYDDDEFSSSTTTTGPGLPPFP